MRLFQVLAPNKSSSDRINDLKAKNIFKDAKQTFKKTNKNNNFNNSIRYTIQGGLKSTKNHELKQILARGQVLCGDTNCYISYGDTDKKTCSNTYEIGPTSVKVDTNTNLFSHYVKELIPDDIHMISSYDPSYCVAAINPGKIIDISCSEIHSDGNGIIFDPSGLYTDTNAVGGNNRNGLVKKKHLWNATTILGSRDISGCYQPCQGGSGVNLSLGNSTKQNYLASFDPNNKIMFIR